MRNLTIHLKDYFVITEKSLFDFDKLNNDLALHGESTEKFICRVIAPSRVNFVTINNIIKLTSNINYSIEEYIRRKLPSFATIETSINYAEKENEGVEQFIADVEASGKKLNAIYRFPDKPNCQVISRLNFDVYNPELVLQFTNLAMEKLVVIAPANGKDLLDFENNLLSTLSCIRGMENNIERLKPYIDDAVFNESSALIKLRQTIIDKLNSKEV